MGRKPISYDDLLHDLDKESFLSEDDETSLLDDEDLELLRPPSVPPPTKPVKKKPKPQKNPKKGKKS